MNRYRREPDGSCVENEREEEDRRETGYPSTSHEHEHEHERREMRDEGRGTRDEGRGTRDEGRGTRGGQSLRARPASSTEGPEKAGLSEPCGFSHRNPVPC